LRAVVAAHARRTLLATRTHPCVRLFCIIDTLTSASVLPGIEVIIGEFRESVVSASHELVDNMSSYAALRVRRKLFDLD
jgi:hypothetical protein